MNKVNLYDHLKRLRRRRCKKTAWSLCSERGSDFLFFNREEKTFLKSYEIRTTGGEIIENKLPFLSLFPISYTTININLLDLNVRPDTMKLL